MRLERRDKADKRISPPMWPFSANHERCAIRRELRVLAAGNLFLIERLELMSAQIDAFNVALDGLLARMDVAEAGQAAAESLRDQIAVLQAELDAANAALTDGAARMNARTEAQP